MNRSLLPEYCLLDNIIPDASWDFLAETVNGTENIWWILEGQNYPRLTWELVEE
jgi:hypothetical protein